VTEQPPSPDLGRIDTANRSLRLQRA